mmetsp:Transcript_32902/g.44550  ORF Transcript_32902/g.44550 Transcript_32902/m.44550 type:complete len:234 (+) Transcript_32902:44-745(+)
MFFFPSHRSSPPRHSLKHLKVKSTMLNKRTEKDECCFRRGGFDEKRKPWLLLFLLLVLVLPLLLLPLLFSLGGGGSEGGLRVPVDNVFLSLHPPGSLPHAPTAKDDLVMLACAKWVGQGRRMHMVLRVALLLVWLTCLHRVVSAHVAFVSRREQDNKQQKHQQKQQQNTPEAAMLLSLLHFRSALLINQNGPRDGSPVPSPMDQWLVGSFQVHAMYVTGDGEQQQQLLHVWKN